MAEQKKYISNKTGIELDAAIGKVLNIEETLSGTAATIPSSKAVKNYVDSKKDIGTDITIEQGGYNDSSGEPVDNLYAIRTPLMEFEYLKIWTTTNSDGQYIGYMYDENKRFLGKLNDLSFHRGINVLCANSIYNEGSVKYVAFCFVNADSTAITPQDFDSLNIKLYLYSGIKSGMKKKISCIGDSITLGYGNVSPYPSFLSPYYDSVNLGITTTEWSGPTKTAFWRRIANVATDTDIISIMGGTNDWLHNNALGTLSDGSDTQETSFYGALKYTAEYVINNFPKSKLCFITPIRCKDNAFGQVENGLNNLGLSLREYAQAIVDVGLLYSIPVLDLNAVCDINPNYPSHQIYYLYDGCHPSSVGNERIFNKIFSFIKSL